MPHKGASRDGHRIGADRKADQLDRGIDAAAGAQGKAGVKIKRAGAKVKFKLAAEAGERYAEAELADKTVTEAAVGGLEGARGGREIVGRGKGISRARKKDIARTIEHYASAELDLASAEERRVEHGTGGVQLAEKHSDVPRKGGLQSVRRGGEIAASCITRYVAVTRSIHGDAKANVLEPSAQIGGIYEG